MSMNYEDLKKDKSLAPSKGGFPALLEKMKPQIAAALPRHLNADRMARIALTEFRKNPKIGQCDMGTILGAIITLSQLGLEPGVMGQAFLVPYKDTCQGIPGWQGLADLVSRTGRASVWTGAVYRGDEFDYAYGDKPFITHRPGESEEKFEDLLYLYAVGRVKGAEWPVIEVWSKHKVIRHRNKHNKVGDRHYSHDNFEMYGRKVPLLQVIKYMPKSVELQLAIDLENAAQTGVTIDLSQVGDASWAIPETPKVGEPETSQPPDGPSAAKKAGRKPGRKAKPKDDAPPPAEPAGPVMSYSDIYKASVDADTPEKIDELIDATRGIKDEKKREGLVKILSQRREDLAGEDREPGSDDAIPDME